MLIIVNQGVTDPQATQYIEFSWQLGVPGHYEGLALVHTSSEPMAALPSGWRSVTSSDGYLAWVPAPNKASMLDSINDFVISLDWNNWLPQLCPRGPIELMMQRSGGYITNAWANQVFRVEIARQDGLIGFKYYERFIRLVWEDTRENRELAKRCRVEVSLEAGKLLLRIHETNMERIDRAYQVEMTVTEGQVNISLVRDGYVPVNVIRQSFMDFLAQQRTKLEQERQQNPYVLAIAEREQSYGNIIWAPRWYADRIMEELGQWQLPINVFHLQTTDEGEVLLLRLQKEPAPGGSVQVRVYGPIYDYLYEQVEGGEELRIEGINKALLENHKFAISLVRI